MTLYTTTTPLDPQAYAEWKTEAETWILVSYSGLSTAHQALFDQLLNEAIEYAGERGALREFTRKTSFNVVSDKIGTDEFGGSQFTMPLDFRRVVSIVEKSGSDFYKTRQSSVRDVYDSMAGTEHPWASDVTMATWFEEGKSDATPPRRQWVRMGGPASGTAYFVYRPYFRLLDGTDTYPLLPAEETAIVRSQFQHKWSVCMKNWEAANQFKAAREDDIFAVEAGGRDNTEAVIRLGVDPNFRRSQG